VADPVPDQPEDEIPAELAGAAAETAPEEIDLSSEWDDTITIDADALETETAEAIIREADASIPSVAASPTVEQPKLESKQTAPPKPDPAQTAETIEEIRFYIEHGMPEQAASAFEKLQTLTEDQDILQALRAEIDEGVKQGEVVEEVSAVDSISEFAIDEPSADAAVPEIPVAAAEEPAAFQDALAVTTDVASEIEAPALEAVPAVTEPPAAEVPAVAAQSEHSGVLQEFVSDLESSLPENFIPATVSHEAELPVGHATADPQQKSEPELEPVGESAPTVFGTKQI
jgi:hypothetical protein